MLKEVVNGEGRLPVEKEIFLELSAPVSVQWEVTPWCNEQCVHCYNFWRTQPMPRLRPSEDNIATYQASTREIINNKVFHVTITGGEPLAVLPWVAPFMEQLGVEGVSMSVNSNLTLLSRERANFLKHIGVRTVLTSLMSDDAELNDALAGARVYERIQRGIEVALEVGLWVAVNMVVTKKNLSHVFSTAKYVKSLGVDSFSATKASRPIDSFDFGEYALSRGELNIMLAELLRVRDELHMKVDSLEFYPHCAFDTVQTREVFGNRICNAGKTACTIGFDGLVRPCSHASMTYGSIHDGLRNAWMGLHPWRTDKFIPQECDPCPVRNICAGGCRTEAYAEVGNLAGLDPYCDFVRAAAHVARPLVEPPSSGSYEFNPHLRKRQEEFGGILYVSPVRWIATAPSLYEFAGPRPEYFTREDLARVLGVPESEAETTIRLLLDRSIIQERG